MQIGDQPGATASTPFLGERACSRQRDIPHRARNRGGDHPAHRCAHAPLLFQLCSPSYAAAATSADLAGLFGLAEDGVEIGPKPAHLPLSRSVKRTSSRLCLLDLDGDWLPRVCGKAAGYSCRTFARRTNRRREVAAARGADPCDRRVAGVAIGIHRQDGGHRHSPAGHA